MPRTPDSFDAAAVLLDAGADPGHRAKDGTRAWQYGRDELSSFLGEVLEYPFPDLRHQGFTYGQLAEPYRQFRTARLAGTPVQDADRTTYFLSVLEQTRHASPSARGAATGGNTPTQSDRPRDADERTLQDFEVHWGHLKLTTRGLWLASKREIGSDFRFDSSVDRVLWQDVGGAGVHRRSDPDSFRPFARKHVVVVRVRGSDDMTIWCKDESQAYEIASAIDRMTQRA